MIKRCKCGKFIKKSEITCNKCGIGELDCKVDYDEKEDKQNAELSFVTKIDKQNIAVGNNPYSMEELIDLFKIDRTVWVPNVPKINYWDMTTREGITYRNYQFKVSFVRKDICWNYEDLRKDFISLCKDYSPTFTSKKYEYLKDEENLLEINIFDAHIGKLCYHAQTGDNYDTKIAYERFMKSIDMAVKWASVFK